MPISYRKADVFAAGVLFGAAAVWLVVFLVSRGSSTDAAARANVASAPPVSVPTTYRGPAPVAATPSPAPVAAAAPGQKYAQCPAQAATTPGPDGDGRLKLQADVSGKSASDVATLIVVGKEAAAADRPRDAEVAFMMACRASDSLLAANSMLPADARYQLGWHYANAVLAGDSGAGPKRSEMLRRSELLFSESLQSYVAKYGRAHEKSRFASEGLAKVQQHLASSNRPPVTVAAAPSRPGPAAAIPAPVTGPPAAIVPRQTEAPSPVAVAQPAPSRISRTRTRPPQRRDEEVTAVRAPARQATGEANRAAPSFDCRRARSYSERTICADSELARLDRDLGRLHARAKSAALDSAAFRRRNDREWQRRESTCRDRQCLVRWYAERREQLLNDDAENFSGR